jgi:hypothetical protein
MSQPRQSPPNQQPVTLAAPKTPKSGRFADEAQLSRVFQKCFSSNGDQCVWLSELESPNGIADLAAIRLKNARSLPHALALIPPRWAYALRCLPLGTPITAAEFAVSLNVTPAHSRTILDRFEAAGFCVFERPNRSWTKIIQPQPVADKIVSIELKLSDWKRALYQASRYLDFSNQTWVVLDERALDRAGAHIEAFVDRGIGLAGMSSGGDLHVECSPADRSPRLLGRFWHMNAEIARRLVELRLQVPAIESV